MTGVQTCALPISNDDRNAFYYGRELYFYGQYDTAARELKRYLKLPNATWAPERAAAMRFIAKSLPNESEQWLLKAVAEAPGRREALVDLAKLYYERKDWKKSLRYAEEALSIEEKPLEYLCEAEAWGWMPWDHAAIAAYNLEKYDDALMYGTKALSLKPSDARLSQNLSFYVSAISPSS